jgi:hypothetical protein
MKDEPKEGDTCVRCGTKVRRQQVRDTGSLESSFTPKEYNLGCECFTGPTLVPDD